MFLGGVIGLEVVLHPRLGREAVYAWGGLELEYEPGHMVQAGLNRMMETSSSTGDRFSSEVGGYVNWYWDMPFLESEAPYSLTGAAVYGGYGGSEGAEPGGPRSLMIGMTSNVDPALFHMEGKSVKIYDQPMSLANMQGAVAVSESAFTALGSTRSGIGFVPGVRQGALAAMIINAALTAEWVRRTYGHQ